MISSQILQNTIDGLKNITRKDIIVAECEGKVVASTEESMMNMRFDNIPLFISSQADSQLVQGYQYFKVNDNGVTEYVVLISGEGEDCYTTGKIVVFQIQSLLTAYKERYDRDNFIKNLLLDNLLLVDIYNRAKKLKIENNVNRVVFLIQTHSERDVSVVEILRNIFPTKMKDFVTAIDEQCVILVKELKDGDSQSEIEKVAGAICDTLSGEAMASTIVSIGTVISDLKNVSSSYKEAKMALEVGQIFEPDNNIINYEKLGIGRLIYQLPSQLCKMFVDEVLHGKTVDQFDEELLVTANKFFENNLNVSETSRQLYIHRNTLVYRLDKLQKMTGLDLRTFDDAIIFKITLMVSRYMSHKNKFMY